MIGHLSYKHSKETPVKKYDHNPPRNVLLYVNHDKNGWILINEGGTEFQYYMYGNTSNTSSYCSTRYLSPSGTVAVFTQNNLDGI